METHWPSEKPTQLVDVRRRTALLIAEEERLYQRYREHSTLADRWLQRAKLALNKGFEPLARQALERHRHYQALAEAYCTEFEEQRRVVEGLKRELQRYENGWSAVRSSATIGEEGTVAAAKGPLRNESIARIMLELEADPVAYRLDAMEREDTVERQLAELKARLAGEAEAEA